MATGCSSIYSRNELRVELLSLHQHSSIYGSRTLNAHVIESAGDPGYLIPSMHWLNWPSVLCCAVLCEGFPGWLPGLLTMGRVLTRHAFSLMVVSRLPCYWWPSIKSPTLLCVQAKPQYHIHWVTDRVRILETLVLMWRSALSHFTIIMYAHPPYFNSQNSVLWTLVATLPPHIILSYLI